MVVSTVVLGGGRGGGGCGGVHDRCGGNHVGPSGGFSIESIVFCYRFDHGRPFSKIDEIVSIMVEFFERSKY